MKTTVEKTKSTWYVNIPKSPQTFDPVEGRRVIVEGFEQFDFFLHLAIRGVDEDRQPIFYKKKWMVSEGRTGSVLLARQRGTRSDTQSEALEKLCDVLDKKVKDLDKQIMDYLFSDRGNLSPLYRRATSSECFPRKLVHIEKGKPPQYCDDRKGIQ